MDFAFERYFMIDFTNRWLISQGMAPMTWEEIEALEGGTGKGRCRTIQDALSRPGTWPHRWFSSSQTDISAYQELKYVYSLMWAAYSFSLVSYSRMHMRWRSDINAETVGDVGGSLYTAFRLVQFGAKEVYVYNFPDSPQGQIISDFAKMYGTPIIVTDDHELIASKCSTLIMKAYLEHFPDVDVEMDKWLIQGRFNGALIADNSFCEIAYGHYIPIKIFGEQVNEIFTAHALFEDLMNQHYGFRTKDSISRREGSELSITRFKK